ncbi:TetR/AcrR family transcriptional regulator [Tateyamaria sp. ANG-S1]|uniref:TetR/AcrR family transcriptional regulator n=1 Tax=Tateyamaria sp. ANG-S1 TaxID=1577905 RepID=UPI00068BB607|nr:TetR/AcrR family transcriptional regulator [Tateyamaria sp. ANG-S1]
MSKRAEQILELAEAEMRRGGFDAVSFRDLAEAAGIKSASVHYHFPTKADLGKAVVQRYADAFLDGLGAPLDAGAAPAERMDHLANAYRAAYAVRGSSCLCAVLGAVQAHLPDVATQEVRAFYDRLQAWIADALADHAPELPPRVVISLLQGAMILAVATEDATALDDARASLAALVLQGV